MWFYLNSRAFCNERRTLPICGAFRGSGASFAEATTATLSIFLHRLWLGARSCRAPKPQQSNHTRETHRISKEFPPRSRGPKWRPLHFAALRLVHLLHIFMLMRRRLDNEAIVAGHRCHARHRNWRRHHSLGAEKASRRHNECKIPHKIYLPIPRPYAPGGSFCSEIPKKGSSYFSLLNRRGEASRRKLRASMSIVRRARLFDRGDHGSNCDKGGEGGQDCFLPMLKCSPEMSCNPFPPTTRIITLQ